MPIIVAIDGPSGAGKGILSQQLCEKYGFAFLDTGLLFRATALKASLKGIAVDEEAKLAQLAKTLEPQDFEDMKELRSEKTGQMASRIAVLPKLRAALISFMRDFAANEGTQGAGAVIDGRDIGTIVCPNADVKFFVTASAEIRATRRLNELQERGIPVIFEEVLQEMLLRDRRDRERKDAPLVAASDAVVIDTTDMSIADVVDLASRQIDAALARA